MTFRVHGFILLYRQGGGGGMDIFVGKGPMDCTRQELAKMAFYEAGIYDDEKFSDYWARYQELLVQKFGYEAQYLADMLTKQCDDSASDCTQKLRFPVFFSLGFLVGFFITLGFFLCL